MEEELQAYKDQFRKGLVKYSRKAFRMLPQIAMPSVLDIGCGSGVPTMELAKLSNAKIIAIDIDETALDKLASKVKKAGLSARVEVEKCSMLKMDFPDGSFDIIWAEGSINVIGFEKGLKDWRRLLKAGGFLVIHDELGDLSEKQKHIIRSGYDLIDYFILNEDTWWNKYYAPLEKKITEIRLKHTGEGKNISVLNDNQREIDAFKRAPQRYRSVFLIMRKIE